MSKYLIIRIVIVLLIQVWGLFIFWVGGGELSRNVALAAMLLANSAISCSVLYITDRQIASAMKWCN